MFGIAAAGAVSIAQAPPAERRSVWDGVYTVGSRPLDRDAAQLERIVIEKAPKETGK